MTPSPDSLSRLAADLDRYEAISLEDLKHSDAQLLDRKESKFLMNVDQFSELVTLLAGSYRVLKVDDLLMSGYMNEYYDTDSFTTYLQHHNGKANRYKLRVRHYLSSGETYLEIKQKLNTGQTVKKRIPVENDAELSESEPKAFLSSHFPYDYRAFHPVLKTRYNRITLVSKNHPERITFDLLFSFEADGDAYGYPELVIGEIKHNCPMRESPAGRVLQQMGVHDTGFSKYCIGVALTYCRVKHNRFKPKLLLLDKLCPGGSCLC